MDTPDHVCYIVKSWLYIKFNHNHGLCRATKEESGLVSRVELSSKDFQVGHHGAVSPRVILERKYLITCADSSKGSFSVVGSCSARITSVYLLGNPFDLWISSAVDNSWFSTRKTLPK